MESGSVSYSAADHKAVAKSYYAWRDRHAISTDLWINGKSSVLWAVVIAIDDSMLITDKPIACYGNVTGVGPFIALNDKSEGDVYFTTKSIIGNIIHVESILERPGSSSYYCDADNSLLKKFIPVGSLVNSGFCVYSKLARSYYEGKFNRPIASIMRQCKVTKYFKP